MTLDQSIFQLWFLGLVWTLGPWLALGFAAVLATLVIRKISDAARGIERRPVEEGVSGFLGVLRSSWLHRALTSSAAYIVFGCIMLGGFVTAGIQGFARRNIHETVRDAAQDELVVPPIPGPDSSGDGVFDWIILGGLIMACVAIMIGVIAYRRLRRHAVEVASHLPSRDSSRPLVVKLFYDKQATGIAILVVGCWILWGLLSQMAGLAIYMSPGVNSLQSIPGVEKAAMVFLVILGIAMFGVMFAPLAWLSVRNIRLQVRHLRKNRVARRLFYVNVAVSSGLVGSLLNMFLIDLLGNLFWPGVFTR
jgi:hypothetical protein